MPGAYLTALALLLAACSARAGRVPPIPAGHRAQYSLQHADGSFKYGWDTGRGSTAQVEGDANNEVRGSYSAGPGLQVQYTAGVNGYVPTLVSDGQGPAGGHAPPPAPPAAHGVKSGWSSGWSVGVPAVHAPAPHAPAIYAPAVKGAHVGPAGPLRPDGSYSFSYSTGEQSRHESGDAANNVRGSFSFRTDDGDRTVNYHAGANTGFVAQGAHLPTPPPVLLIPAVAIPVQIPVQSNGRWGQADGLDDGQDDVQDDGKWAAEEPEPEPEPDSSYQFSYQGKDGSRQEASDAGGNVQGSYSYTDPDGVVRRVDYEAGPGKGFVANVQPKDEPSGQPGGQPSGGVQTSWQSGGGVQTPWQPDGGAQTSWQSGGGVQTPWQPDGGAQTSRGGDDGLQQVLDDAQQLDLGPGDAKRPPSDEDANTQSSHGPDGSYAFAYSTKDQSREEHADAKNNVEGSYTFVAKDDGKERRVDYIAGAKTGFVAQLSESDGPVQAPGAGPSTQTPSVREPIDVQKPIGQEPIGQEPIGQEPIGQEPIGQEQVTLEPDVQEQATEAPGDIDIRVDDKIDLRRLSSSDDSQQTTDGDEGSGAGAGDEQTSRGPDGSYAFSYSTKDQSREEQADAKNNVKGSFSFVAPDGVQRRVDYEAGAGKGFVAKGDHLPKQEGAPEAAGQTHQDDGQQTQSPEDGDEQQTQSPEPGDGGSDDASYAYSYETPSSRKQESADAAGNVQGSFSYNDGTGQTKTVTYTARRGEGFKADGDHLPKPGQFLAAAAAAGVGGSVHGGAYGRARGRPRPGVGVKTLQPKPTAAWPPPLPPRSGATWPHGLQPQGPNQDASVRTYLPPGVPGHKVGYVYEAKSR